MNKKNPSTSSGRAKLDIGTEVLKKIKDDHIEPKPKWQFLLKDCFVWLAGAASLMIGSLAFAVVIYMVRASDWEFYEHISGGLLNFVFAVIPYFWIVFLVIFVIIADYNFKHTKDGYKYKAHWVVIASILLSMVFGSFLHVIGLGQAIDDVFAEKIPVYERVFNKSMQKARMWTQPERGLLVGVITSVEDSKHFGMMDLTMANWVVDAQDASFESGFKIEEKNKVRVVGERVRVVGNINMNEKIFRAKKVLSMPIVCSRFNKECLMRKKMEDLIKGGKRHEKLPPAIRGVKTGENCEKHEDCAPNMDFMIRSNCPFISRCIDGVCKVVCEEPYPWKEMEGPICENDKDCDCKHYIAEDLKGCVCVDGRCGAVVAE